VYVHPTGAKREWPFLCWERRQYADCGLSQSPEAVA
jgi:hypothetical protein